LIFAIYAKSFWVFREKLQLLLFAYLSKEIFYWPIENQLLISELSVGGIFKIIILYILYLLAVKKKVKIIIRRKL